jgi:hypothetical protein
LCFASEERKNVLVLQRIRNTGLKGGWWCEFKSLSF